MKIVSMNLLKISMLFKKIIRKILTILDKFGVNYFFSYINKKTLLILIYHGISDREFNFNHRRYYPKSLFEKEVKYLKRRGYHFITLTEWLYIIEKKNRIKNKYVILTFDDGFKNVINCAYPLMKKHGARGCLYVVSGLIGSEKLIWSDYLEIMIKSITEPQFYFKFKGQEFRYSLNSPRNIQLCISDIKNKLRTLSNIERINHLNQFKIKNHISNFNNVPEDYLMANWEELKSIDNRILEIGGHSKTHPNLASLKEESELKEELYGSKIEIEEKLKSTIDHFCYPVGSYNKNTIKYVKKYGYLTAVTIREGFNSPKTDLFQLKRLNIKNDFILFKYKISGLSLLGKRLFEPIKKILKNFR